MEVYLTGILGTTRVRKGMPRSLPLGLLIPTVPCCKFIMNIHRDLRVLRIKPKTIDDQSSLRMSTIFFVNKGHFY